MNVHYFLHPLVKISSIMFSISILWCWGAKWYSEYITTQWGCLLNPFHHMLYEIGKTTLQNSDFIQIWKFSQTWISFQNESVRLESDLKNIIMSLSFLSIPSPICLEMLNFGTFFHFQKAHGHLIDLYLSIIYQKLKV